MHSLYPSLSSSVDLELESSYLERSLTWWRRQFDLSACI